MSVFKDEVDTKRVIFNVRLDLAQRLEQAKKDARDLGKKLDVDGAIDKSLEKFLKKAEKKIAEVHKKRREEKQGFPIQAQRSADTEDEPDEDETDDAEDAADSEADAETDESWD